MFNAVSQVSETNDNIISLYNEPQRIVDVKITNIEKSIFIVYNEIPEKNFIIALRYPTNTPYIFIGEKGIAEFEYKLIPFISKLITFDNKNFSVYEKGIDRYDVMEYIYLSTGLDYKKREKDIDKVYSLDSLMKCNFHKNELDDIVFNNFDNVFSDYISMYLKLTLNFSKLVDNIAYNGVLDSPNPDDGLLYFPSIVIPDIINNLNMDRKVLILDIYNNELNVDTSSNHIGFIIKTEESESLVSPIIFANALQNFGSVLHAANAFDIVNYVNIFLPPDIRLYAPPSIVEN